jgi:hypothetical protein
MAPTPSLFERVNGEFSLALSAEPTDEMFGTAVGL